MTAPVPETLEGALARRLDGARIDAVAFNPVTGLLTVQAFGGEKCRLGAGIGPLVTGLGWLPRMPSVRAGSAHPLVAALRARVVDHRVRSVVVHDGVVWLAVGGGDVVTRVGIAPGRHGWCEVLGADGARVVRVPAQGGEASSAFAAGDPAGLEAAGEALVADSDRRSLERTRTVLARAIGRRVQAVEKRMRAVEHDLARLGGVERLQKIGRLLLAQGPRIPRGSTHAVLEDWEEGGTVELTLDPARPAKSQAETFFAKARRLQRGEVVMRRRLAETEALWSPLATLAEAVAGAEPTVSVLDELAAQARALGVTDVPASARNAQVHATVAPREPFHAYVASGGASVLVGRGGRDNDTLTTKHARPHDLWLHAKGVPGAHVVVQLDRGRSCPPELLADAAMLAAYFSDARGETVCDVTYVDRRYVRKVKGGAPGAVTFEREKVIAVRVDPERLAALLASRG